MNESHRLIAAFKKLLKMRGYTYRHVASEMGLSEQSIKRMFANGTFTLARLVQLSGVLKMSLAEVLEQTSEHAAQIRILTEAQEKELVADHGLLLVTVCVLNGWSLAEIIGMYRFTKAECLRKLLRLDKLGLINLLPGDRIRLNIARDFDWLLGGPIRKFFRKLEKTDFLASDFSGEDEQLLFLNGMLTSAARAKLDAQIRKLREEFAELHRESSRAPFGDRRGVCLLLAQREWEPQIFAQLRRTQC